MADSSQKFIARNRAPRVQIEYDVELYGAEKKVQLPFVMGVMSDLAGKSNTPQPAIADRKFLEIDVDNFDERMRAIAPRAAFTVPNTLTGEGNLAIDLTFESMKDFTPGAVAAKVDALRPLLEARQQLEQLMTYMDGKTGAETLIEQVLATPALLSSLAGQAGANAAEAEAALASLRGAALPEAADEPDTSSILGALSAQAPQEVEPADTSTDVLAGLRANAPVADAEEDRTTDVLSALAASTPDVEPEDTSYSDALDSLAAVSLPVAEAEDASGSILAELAANAPQESAAVDPTNEALASLADQAVTTEETNDIARDVLAELAAREAPVLTKGPEADDILANLERSEEKADEPEADLSALIGDLAVTEEDAEDDTDAILAGIEVIEDEPEADNADEILSGIEAIPEETEAEDTDLATLLGDLDVPEVEETSSVADVLAGLEPVTEAEPEPEANLSAMLEDMALPEEDTADNTDAILAGIEAITDTPADNSSDEILSGIEAVPDEPEAEDTDLAALLGDLEEPEAEETTSLADVMAGLEPIIEAAPEPEADLTAILGDLPASDEDASDSTDAILAGVESIEEAVEEDLDLDALLGSLDHSDAAAEENSVEDPLLTLEPEAETGTEVVDLDEILSSEETDEDSFDLDALLDEAASEDAPLSESDADDSFDLDALLTEASANELPADPADEDFDLDSFLAEDASEATTETDEAFDLDALLAEGGADLAEQEPDEEGSDLDDLLADLGISDESTDGAEDLDALFSDLETEAEVVGEADDLGDLDALLGDLDSDDESDLDLDGLLGDLGVDLGDEEDDLGPVAQKEPRSKEPELAYGRMSASRPEPQKLERKRFRLAIFGDFTGRAAKGQLDTGAALAAHKPMVLDPDTFEEVIESFATELVLPIGKEGAGIAVKLNEFDDLHPDELFDNVALFSELISLRKQLQSGVTKDHAMKTLAAWAEAHGTPARAPKGRSGGNAVPADLRLSDFQKLIGDTSGSLRAASPIEDMLARVVGPHIRALPDANLGAMQTAVDEALSDAMRLVLHHPEFQSIEAQWRSLDLIQRSIEVDDTLEVVLYDVSAEELAADLAAQEDLAESGFVKLLTEGPMDPENGRGAYSALIGLYTFEETPPHAELLGRFARVAAHVDAPFLASVTPGFWDTAKEDRPKIVADAWETLRGMTEAGHLGLLTPRFLLRRPYGAKSEPIDPFDFEEFTPVEGLRGMLWGNPAVLAAILMAKSFKKNGSSLQLGSIMSLGDMPYHYVNDRFGDQVALPCTERNVDLDKIASAKERGFMSIASVRGRDEIRLTSFNSLRGDVLLGPWTGMPAPAPSPADPRPAKQAPAVTEAAENLDLDDLGLDLDFDGDGGGLDDDLDALLAGFGDDDTGSDGELDAELEALLNDL